ncbi:MAG: hypothetical protein AB1758_21140 [Candidatus Eremiobacterota bacterium]
MPTFDPLARSEGWRRQEFWECLRRACRSETGPDPADFFLSTTEAGRLEFWERLRRAFWREMGLDPDALPGPREYPPSVRDIHPVFESGGR